MAIRKDLVWTVADDLSISPSTPLEGGVQGEDKAVLAKFVLGENHPLIKDGYQLYIECEDPTGAYDKTDLLPLDEEGAISVEVPLAWTQYGGTVRLNVAAEKEGKRVETDAAMMTFRNRGGKLKRMQTLIQTHIQKLLDWAALTLTRAEDAQKIATNAASNAAGAANSAITAAGDAATSAAAAEEYCNTATVATSAASKSASEAAASAAAAQEAAERSKTLIVTTELVQGVAPNGAPLSELKSTHSASEIYAHVQNGGTAVLDWMGGECLSLSGCTEEAAVFSAVTKDGIDARATIVTIDNDKGWSQSGAGLGDDAVLFTEQTLTDEQKAQARKNIGAGLPPLKFTVTKNEGGSYTSSKTHQELADGFAEGRTLICVFEGIELPLVENNGYAMLFSDYTNGRETQVCINTVGSSDFESTLVTSTTTCIRIGDQMWGGDDEEFDVDFTDTINKMIDDKVDDVTADLAAAQTAIADQCIVNARDYGAKGDGVTDDTAAIQAALHYAEDNDLPLYIPAGTYLVSKTISTYTRDTDAAKQSKALHIFGAGMNTKFVTADTFEGDYVFHIDVAKAQPRMLWVHDFAIDLVADVSGIYFREIGMKAVVENLWITYLYDKDPDDTNVRAGIYCKMSTCTTFQRIKVYGNRKHIDQGHENIGIVCEGTYSTKFIDCDIIFCKWAIYLSGGSNNLIEYCRIDENEYGVYQNTTAPTINYMPETRAYPADGEKFQGTARNLTIRNNRFEANNQQAIFLAAYSYGEMNYMYNAQVTIANNDFSSLGKDIAFQTSAREVFRKAIWLYQSKGVVIENNCFSGQPYDETVEDTALQNLVGERIEDITLRGNVATTRPIWYDDGSHTIEKSNPVLSVEFVEATDFIADIEADQSSRYSLGDISLALDSIIAIQNELIGPALITFTIGGTEYQAEAGMTWAGWCESEYNTGGYHVDWDTNTVHAENDDLVGFDDEQLSSPTDVIVADCVYVGDL